MSFCLVLVPVDPPVGVLDPDFTLCIVNFAGELWIFIESTVSPEILLRFYDVKKSSYEELLKVLNNEVWLVRRG